MQLQRRHTTLRPAHVLVLAIAYLTVAWSLVYLIDVFNVGGLREWTRGMGLETPGFWYSLFQEGSPTEWLQWLGLGAAGIVAAIIAGRLHEADGDRAHMMFWLLISIALTLMLIEDAGNPRHKMAQYATALAGSRIGGHVIELIYYAALASVPLYAILRYGRSIWPLRATRNYLLAAFGLYAIAGGTSALRYVGDWYERAGAWIDAHLMLGRLERADIYHSHEFWLMDCAFEESIELLGAAAFLTAAVAFQSQMPRTAKRIE